MPKQRFTTEENIHKLREADVLIGQGGATLSLKASPSAPSSQTP